MSIKDRIKRLEDKVIRTNKAANDPVNKSIAELAAEIEAIFEPIGGYRKHFERMRGELK